MTFRVATWNLDHASNRSRPVDKQIEQIKSINADVWVLTETCDKVSLADAGFQSRTPRHRNKYGKYWTTIWSRFQFSSNQVLDVHDTETATAAEVETPGGRLLVYGTVLTWMMDRGADGTSANWVEHHKAIEAHGNDWVRLRELDRGRPMIAAGDFNQTRDGSRKYCSDRSIELLSTQLERSNLLCVTESDFGRNGQLNIDPRKGYYRHNIDHICLTAPLQAVKVGAWDHFSEKQELTDHNGVFVDVKWRA